MYCTGWIKRGATGIVGSNIADARETVATIKERLEGMAAKAQPTVRDGEGVSWEGWKKIEEYEATHGLRCPEQPREKVTDIERLEKISRTET